MPSWADLAGTEWNAISELEKDLADARKAWEKKYCGSVKTVAEGKKLFYADGKIMYKPASAFHEKNGKMYLRNPSEARMKWLTAVSKGRDGLGLPKNAMAKKGSVLHKKATAIMKLG